MTEDQLRRLLIRHLPAGVVWSQRVETGIGAGWPDMLMLPKGKPEVWAELKVTVEPIRSGSKLLRSRSRLRPEQRRWIAEVAQFDRGVWLLVGTNAGRLFLACGLEALLLDEASYREAERWSVKDMATAVKRMLQ